MTDTSTSKPHSADYFGEQRDYWWNSDFIGLMARRWKLDQVHVALDVGAGIGHWGRLLAPHLAPRARVVGIDLEPTWIEEARARAERSGLGDRLSYRLGNADHIPFHDREFDLVTCQTLLIHVPDPRAVLREMRRVLKPGGLLAVAEPNNLSSIVCLGSTAFDRDTESIVDMFRLHLMCQRGKAKLGEGHNSIGDLMPGWFNEVGLNDISVHLSDKASSLIPPYGPREQEVRRAEMIDFANREQYAWDRADTRRFFLAGGGTEVDFDRLWEIVGSAARDTKSALESNTEHQAGGGVHYLVAGRRPA
jgi:SAM-dependent methyltransferase